MPNVTSQIARLVTGTTANVTGDAFTLPPNRPYRCFTSTIAGTGAVSATATVEGSIDGDNWTEIASMSLSGTDADAKHAEDIAVWPMIRGKVASITGTDATVSILAAI